MTIAEYRKRIAVRRRGKVKGSGGKRPAPRPVRMAKGAMNQTESRYWLEVLGGAGEYEAERLEVTTAEKHVYTPDFRRVAEWGTEYHEVKGTYRLQSQDGARVRWAVAAERHPAAVFVWAKLRRDGRWNIEIWRDGGARKDKACGVTGYGIGEKGEIQWMPATKKKKK